MFDQKLQCALLQAAKVGHVKLMREFIKKGADPYTLDELGCNAIFYASNQNLQETLSLLEELELAKEGKNVYK